LAFEPVNAFGAYESMLKNTLNSYFHHFGTHRSVFLFKFSAKSHQKWNELKQKEKRQEMKGSGKFSKNVKRKCL